MSQYPSPYNTPIYYPPGYPQVMSDPRAPARRAAILMIALGGIILLMGGCIAGISGMITKMIDQMPAEQRKFFDEISQLGIKPEHMFLGIGIFLVVVGLLYVMLGIFTRSGGLGMVITSIVLTTITVLYLLLNAVSSLFQGILAGVCFSVAALSLFILLMVWLIQAAKASGRIRQIQEQYQAQYMQYQQMQQQYGQAGYGYGYPAPPPPPAPQQQPQPSDSNPPPPQQ